MFTGHDFGFSESVVEIVFTCGWGVPGSGAALGGSSSLLSLFIRF